MIVPTELHPLEGHTALITGATRGIGRAVAHRLGRAGAQVLLNSRNADDLNNAVHAFRSDNICAEAMAFDVTNEASANKALKDRNISILVLNVGTNLRKPLGEFTTDEFRSIIENNL